MLESGKLVHKIGFEIDNKSWRNLDNFQKRIGELKAQMKGLSGAVNLKVNATQFKQQAEKVAKIQQQAQIKVAKQTKGADKTYASWWTDSLKDRDKSNELASKRANTKGADKTYSSWWSDELKKKDAEAKIMREDEKRYNAYWEKLRKVDEKGYKQRATTRKKYEDPNKLADDMAKRDAKITRKREMIADRMNRAGVSSPSQRSFFSAFDNQAGIYKKTGDLAAFNHQVNRSSSLLMHQSKSAKSVGRQMKDLRSTMVAATQAYTAFSVVQNVANTGMQLEGMQAGMKVFAGSDANVKAEFDYIVEQSRRMGVNFEAAAQQYTKFNIVARNKLSTAQRKEMFESMSEYATVMQVDPEQYKRAFNAVNQILSKGTVQSEEFSLRLGS